MRNSQSKQESKLRFHCVTQLFSEFDNSPLQLINDSHIHAKQVQLTIKRDDLIHSIISGNKWRKLKYLLLSIENLKYKRIAAMGGPYSNFLHALSYVCYLLGWQCQLYVRGYRDQPLTPTLKDCLKWNATIIFVNRVSFREMRMNKPLLADDIYWIKEGGQHELAIPGISEIFSELSDEYDHVLIASATGTSVAGLVVGARKYQPKAKITGISVLNNHQQQISDVNNMIDSRNNNWAIRTGFEFGGFAKKTQALIDFTQQFILRNEIPIEPVYSAKSFFATFELIEKGIIQSGSNVLLIHCGGLQGVRCNSSNV